MQNKPCYYYTEAGQVIGPVSLDVLRRMQEEGLIEENSQACAEGTEDWLPVTSLVDPKSKQASTSLLHRTISSSPALFMLLVLTLFMGFLTLLGAMPMYGVAKALNGSIVYFTGSAEDRSLYSLEQQALRFQTLLADYGLNPYLSAGQVRELLEKHDMHSLQDLSEHYEKEGLDTPALRRQSPIGQESYGREPEEPGIFESIDPAKLA